MEDTDIHVFSDLWAYLGSYMTVDFVLLVLAVIFACMLIQFIISCIVMGIRKNTLRDDYEFTNSQIMGFFWKSILFFPVTWYLLVSNGVGKTLRGTRSLFRKVFRR